MPNGHRRGAILVLVLACASLAFARQRPPAAEPGPGAKPAKPQPAKDGKGGAAAPAAPTLVMSASVASTDKLAAFAKDVGLGDVPFLSATFLEQQLPFVGPGGLAADRPLGALLHAAGEADLENMVYVLPVNPGKAGLKEFADKGAQPLKGRADTVTLEGVGYRRGKNHFIFGAMPAAVAAVREDALASTYAGDRLLAHVDLDVAAIRRAAPGQYEEFFATLDAVAQDSGTPAEGELVTRPLRALTRLALSLASADGGAGGGLRLSLAAEPFTLPQAPPAGFPRPGFPKGTLLRADLAHPPAKALGPSFDAVLGLLDQDHRGKATKEQRARYRAVDAELAALFLGGEAASLGVEVIDGRPVVYWVTQHAAAAPDPGALMKSIVAHETASRKPDARKDGRPPVKTETYAASPGLEAHRLIERAADGSVLCADAVRRERALVMTLASTDGKYVERLLSLKPEGEAAALLSGWVDLSALSASGALPDGEELGIGRTAMDELKAAMQGQRLTWAVSPAQRGARLDVDVPKSLLKALATAAGLAP